MNYDRREVQQDLVRCVDEVLPRRAEGAAGLARWERTKYGPYFVRRATEAEYLQEVVGYLRRLLPGEDVLRQLRALRDR